MNIECSICGKIISVERFVWSTIKTIKWNMKDKVWHTSCQEKEEVEEQMKRDQEFNFRN